MKPKLLYLDGDTDVLTLVGRIVGLDDGQRFDFSPCHGSEDVEEFITIHHDTQVSGVAFLNLEQYGMLHVQLADIVFATRSLRELGMHVIYMTKLSGTDPGKDMVAKTLGVPLYDDKGGQFEITEGLEKIQLQLIDIVDHAAEIMKERGTSPESPYLPGKES